MELYGITNSDEKPGDSLRNIILLATPSSKDATDMKIPRDGLIENFMDEKEPETNPFTRKMKRILKSHAFFANRPINPLLIWL